MQCYKCGDGIESGKSFFAIDEAGKENRRWVCTQCATIQQKITARKNLGVTGLAVTRLFDPEF